jgi:hypothetical protein
MAPLLLSAKQSSLYNGKPAQQTEERPLSVISRAATISASNWRAAEGEPKKRWSRASIGPDAVSSSINGVLSRAHNVHMESSSCSQWWKPNNGRPPCQDSLTPTLMCHPPCQARPQPRFSDANCNVPIPQGFPYTIPENPPPRPGKNDPNPCFYRSSSNSLTDVFAASPREQVEAKADQSDVV